MVVQRDAPDTYRLTDAPALFVCCVLLCEHSYWPTVVVKTLDVGEKRQTPAQHSLMMIAESKEVMRTASETRFNSASFGILFYRSQSRGYSAGPKHYADGRHSAR